LSGSPSSGARRRKADNPSTKTHDPQEQRQFLISNRKSKPSSEAVQENYRQSRRGSVLVCTPFLANLPCFVSNFLKQKIRKSIIKKIADPERRFVLLAETKHVGISCSSSQRGKLVGDSASLLKHGAAIPR